MVEAGGGGGVNRRGREEQGMGYESGGIFGLNVYNLGIERSCMINTNKRGN